MNYKEIKELENCTIYNFEDEAGDANIRVYHLFPGLDVSYISVHSTKLDLNIGDENMDENYVSFHYCKEGRIEQESNNEFFYLMPGDCSVTISYYGKTRFHFPLKHYHGISVDIDTSIIGNRFTKYLENREIDPLQLAVKICKDKQSAILRNIEAITHIFKESYNVEESYRVDYLKIKVLELLFVIDKMEITDLEDSEYYIPRSQADLVKKTAKYISENVNQKVGLQDLTTLFNVSESHLQKSFKAVYGMTVASFIRVQKMQNAAQVLIHTDRTIDDIAEEFGYINESKFSAAFKKIMGDSPSVYRKEHTKVRIA